MSIMKPEEYDLVLENGVYLTGFPLDRIHWPECHRSLTIRFKLKLRAHHGSPLLGPMLRNLWAKKNGAILHERA